MDPTTLLPFDSELSLQDLSAGGHNLSFSGLFDFFDSTRSANDALSKLTSSTTNVFADETDHANGALGSGVADDVVGPDLRTVMGGTMPSLFVDMSSVPHSPTLAPTPTTPSSTHAPTFLPPVGQAGTVAALAAAHHVGHAPAPTPPPSSPSPLLSPSPSPSPSPNAPPLPISAYPGAFAAAPNSHFQPRQIGDLSLPPAAVAAAALANGGLHPPVLGGRPASALPTANTRGQLFQLQMQQQMQQQQLQQQQLQQHLLQQHLQQQRPTFIPPTPSTTPSPFNRDLPTATSTTATTAATATSPAPHGHQNHGGLEGASIRVGRGDLHFSGGATAPRLECPHDARMSCLVLERYTTKKDSYRPSDVAFDGTIHTRQRLQVTITFSLPSSVPLHLIHTFIECHVPKQLRYRFISDTNTIEAGRYNAIMVKSEHSWAHDFCFLLEEVSTEQVPKADRRTVTVRAQLRASVATSGFVCEYFNVRTIDEAKSIEFRLCMAARDAATGSPLFVVRSAPFNVRAHSKTDKASQRSKPATVPPSLISLQPLPDTGSQLRDLPFLGTVWPDSRRPNILDQRGTILGTLVVQPTQYVGDLDLLIAAACPAFAEAAARDGTEFVVHYQCSMLPPVPLLAQARGIKLIEFIHHGCNLRLFDIRGIASSSSSDPLTIRFFPNGIAASR